MVRKRQDKPPSGPRPIVPDFDLWTRLKQTITPLEADRHEATDELPPLVTRIIQATSAVTAPATKMPAKKVQLPIKPKSTSPSPAAAPLTGLDRRTSQRLSRGQIEVDARIDLHGENVENARLKLRLFLENARKSGARHGAGDHRQRLIGICSPYITRRIALSCAGTPGPFAAHGDPVVSGR